MSFRTALLMIAFAAPLWGCAAAEAQECPPAGFTIEGMTAAKSGEYADLDSAQKSSMAMALTTCLGHPHPDIRDGLAYEGMTKLLRSGEIAPTELRDIRETLLPKLQADDDTGFLAPFTALVLAEVSRTDRVETYMSDEAFESLVADAAAYVASVNDYRGFSDTEGWRHGVAHGADWLMQLSLNPRLTPAQADLILGAVRKQVPAADGHAYIHGEPGRLARPVLFVALGSEKISEDWAAWLAPLIDPGPLESWGDAFKSEAELARLHNVKAFLQELYINASVSSNEKLKPLLPPVTDALRALP